MSKAFFIGIKGVGMTALALAMSEVGWEVAGSDVDDVFITDRILQAHNIKFYQLNQVLPQDLDLIVYSGAYTPPQTSIRTLSLAEALAEFVQNRQVIAVAGVGGKTTTSSMLTVMMRQANRQVGYYIGTASVVGLSVPGSAGIDPYYIIEADEYAISRDDHRPKFALLYPRILITTNIIHDHPDIYPDKQATLVTFTQLVRKLQSGSVWIYNHTDPLTLQIIQQEQNNLTDIKLIPYSEGHPLYSQLNLAVFGKFNRLNALASVLAGIEAGLTQTKALQAIQAYQGCERRQQKLGEVKSRLFYDDYGHHPHEIKATLQAFKDQFPQRRLVLVFESHTYSRTEKLFSEFVRALTLADYVFVMPIFESAREKGKSHSLDHHDLANSVKQLGTPAQALEWQTASRIIANFSRPNDLILTMGAGFVYKLYSKISAILQSS